MKQHFLTKEEWEEAAERIILIAEPIAEYLSKLNADGMGEQDKREFLCDMQLAYMAMMHVSEFAADKCGDCDNLGSYTQSRTWYKCERWGRSACIQSDWRKKWTACGMFNVPLPNGARPLKDCIKRTKAEFPPDENQITLDV